MWVGSAFRTRTGAWRRLFVCLCFGVAIATSPGQAAEGQLPTFYNGYKAYVGGFHAFDFTLKIDDNDAGYQADLVLETRGLLQKLRNLKARASVNGHWVDISRLGTYPITAVRPGEYTQAYWRKDKSGLREVRYGGEDRLPVGYRNGKFDEKIPTTLRQGSMDPLTAFVIGRRLAQTIEPGRTKILPIYDGKLRYDFKATLLEQQGLNFGDDRIQVLPVRIEPIARAGFSREQERNWEKRVVTLYFSADGRLEPLKVVVATAFGAFVAQKTGACGQVACVSPLNDYATGK